MLNDSTQIQLLGHRGRRMASVCPNSDFRVGGAWLVHTSYLWFEPSQPVFAPLKPARNAAKPHHNPTKPCCWLLSEQRQAQRQIPELWLPFGRE